MRARLIVAMALAVLLGTAACKSSPEKLDDASITACTPGADDGRPVAEGQVTNSSSKTSSYSVRVNFFDEADNKVTEGVDVATDVEPGSSSPFRVTGVGTMKGAVDCRVSGVTRNAAPGS